MIGNHEKWAGSVEHAGLTDSAMQAVAQVAAAFAARSTATVDDIVALTARLTSVFAVTNTALAPAVRGNVSLSTSPAAVGFEGPAIPIENAVSEDKVFCLCCGRGFTMLKRHLKAEHGLSEEEYRSVFDLHEDMPLVAPSYSARKAAYAKRVGLGKYNRDQEPAAAD
ncbi:MAG: MucR family transcriptional regulator [Rhodobacteraceae bacterium]|nr:MAG: MucR family transcriptional regulator [Paracoccaceae bacterium]